MRELVRMSDDPTTPNQRIRVVEELAEWGMVSIHDEDTTSRSSAAQVTTGSSVILTREEAQWLRDELSGLDLGDDNERGDGAVQAPVTARDDERRALDMMVRQVSTLLALIDSWAHEGAISLGSSADDQMIAEARRLRDAHRAGCLVGDAGEVASGMRAEPEQAAGRGVLPDRCLEPDVWERFSGGY